jgi:hypothetical protein
MGVVVAQGAAFVAAGAAAEVVTPASVIAAAGGAGAVGAVALTLAWRRVTSPQRPPSGRPALSSERPLPVLVPRPRPAQPALALARSRARSGAVAERRGHPVGVR